MNIRNDKKLVNNDYLFYESIHIRDVDFPLSKIRKEIKEKNEIIEIFH